MRKSKAQSGDINGFLDRSTSIKGELRFMDTMRIDGRIEGRIVSDNLLIVGETAEIDADIDVAEISIFGKVSGTLRATSRVEVHADAELRGDVTTPVLRIDEGAVFEGRCDMGRSPAIATEKEATSNAGAARLALVEAAADGLS